MAYSGDACTQDFQTDLLEHGGSGPPHRCFDKPRYALNEWLVWLGTQMCASRRITTIAAGPARPGHRRLDQAPWKEDNRLMPSAAPDEVTCIPLNQGHP
jgi:hypothetical protein